MTKYLEKTFDEAASNARRYWPSKNCERPVERRFWLGAVDLLDAIREAHDLVKMDCASATLSMWLSMDASNIWISGTGFEPPF
ncbi:MAG TPA: hypothetical protein DEP05_10060 [Betaproteobacteria bacterium]|nr:hypothetical protein [Betaproteobacteria bacterium]